MPRSPYRIARRLSVILLVCLTACGGGGGGGSPAATTPNMEPPREASSGSDSSLWPPAVDDGPHCDTQPLVGRGRTFNVGPGQTYTELHQLPWNDMAGGDVVNVFYRVTPYASRVGLRVQATADAPFHLHGVAQAGTCARPMLSGAGARPSDDQQTNRFGAAVEGLGLVAITRGPTDQEDEHRAAWIVIENIRFQDVGADHQFVAYNGTQRSYNAFSAAIYAVRVAHLTVRNCEFVRTAMGVFVNSRGQHPLDHSDDVRLIRNRFEANGHVGSDTIHSTYVQARRALYEGNDLPQLRPGAGGSTLKDRSSATVVRFNRIVSNARALDLVETEEEYVSAVQDDPLYPHAWVYGNLIINDFNQPNGASVNMVHFGYDNTAERARRGTLYFYGNTLVQAGSQSRAWYAQVFQLSRVTPAPQVQAWSNVFAQLGTVEFRFMGEAGELLLRGRNTAPPDWVAVYPGNPGTVQTSGGTLLLVANPGLDADFRLQSGSAARSAAIHPGVTWPTDIMPNHLALSHQFDAVSGVRPRRTTLDLGAFE